MSLVTYRKKRDFGRTSEPRGKTRRSARRTQALSFVVQKHDARRLHYDFRLELDGVLKSWAIPKGPSLDPSEKRLAVETEDHPIEYGDFEGVIPDGEYGAGPVVVWDRGYWKPEGDPRQGYAKGHLRFELEGSKLHGSWHLVRTRGDGKARSWLLIKRSDASAKRGAGAGASLVEEQPESALSGRTIEDVAVEPTRVWHSKRSSAAKSRSGAAKPKTHATKPRSGASRKRPTRDDLPDPSAHPAARKAALPAFVEPQLATLVREAPAGDAWLHEIKLDGYRVQLRLDRGRAQARTRRGHDWSSRMPSLIAAAAKLPIERAILDGELVVLRGGVSDFQRLQNSLSAARDAECVLFVFDLLHLNGYDLEALPLQDRKALLRSCLAAAGAGPDSRIRFNDHVVGKGPEVFEHACDLKLEGTICKRADAAYGSGRSKDWLKVKCRSRQEFVIGGFTEPAGSRAHFGALLLGVTSDGKLHYAGRVGTGFTERSLRELHAKLAPLAREKPAYADPPRGADARDVQWVEPALVAEIEFAERTSDGLVRHASFLGLREDKEAVEVHDERAEVAPSPARPAKNARKRAAKSAGQPLALRSVRLTHPDRVLFPDLGVTKADLALYYARVAERMLPLLENRPLMLVRCPEGVGTACFHQKHPTQGMSASIRRVKIPESKGTFETMYVADADGLVQLVQNGALEIHTWGSRVDDVERPDQITFDLDPDEALPWPRMVEAAQEIKRRLDALELPNFVKTTGGKGLHVVVPVKPSAEWDAVKSACKAFADGMVRADPSRYLATISKAKRKGKILIDYLRNGRGATAICAYSTRARQAAPVATPIAWSELTAKLRPDQFTIQNLPDRLTEEDPWEDFGEHRVALTPALLRAFGK